MTDSIYGLVKWAGQGIPADHQWYDNTAYKTDNSAFVKWEQQWRRGSVYLCGPPGEGSVSYDIEGFRKNPEIVQNNHFTFINPKVGY
ncbi:MAG: hypothetical protein KL787_02095 [Taibaiella sp.]|nr:hypothetical protein [Taibaiella sp.]